MRTRSAAAAGSRCGSGTSWPTSRPTASSPSLASWSAGRGSDAAAPGALLARARRVLPGLWLCLLLTAFGIAPAAAFLSGSHAPSLHEQVEYVVRNSGVWLTRYGIGAGPVGVPHPGVWNGSLWSLGYEAGCYLGLAALGVSGLLRARVVAGLAFLMWMTVCLATLVGAPMAGGAATLPLMIRAVLMFCCGASLYLQRDRVPASRGLAVGALVLLAAGMLTPDYRVVAAPALA